MKPTFFKRTPVDAEMRNHRCALPPEHSDSTCMVEQHLTHYIPAHNEPQNNALSSSPHVRFTNFLEGNKIVRLYMHTPTTPPNGASVWRDDPSSVNTAAAHGLCFGKMLSSCQSLEPRHNYGDLPLPL